jgi:hypothetical protein
MKKEDLYVKNLKIRQFKRITDRLLAEKCKTEWDIGILL